MQKEGSKNVLWEWKEMNGKNLWNTSKERKHKKRLKSWVSWYCGVTLGPHSSMAA